MHALSTHGCGEFAQHIAFGAHLARAPVGEVGLIHGEAVMVLGYWNNIARARVMEELCPRSRIKVLSRESGNEVLVAKTRLRTVCGDLVRKIRRSLLIHIARVPFATKSGD